MIKVIWVALPDLNGEKRRKILEELGFSPFDLMEMLSNKEMFINWNTYMLSGKEHNFNWQETFKDSDALTLTYTDVRIAELAEKNPGCKVIFEQISYEEYKPHLEAMHSFLKLLEKFRFTIRRASRAYTVGSKALEFFSTSNDFSLEVVRMKINTLEQKISQMKVPKYRQLVLKSSNYNWEELCDFLERPIPDKPIPYVPNNNSYFSVFKGVVIEKFKEKWIWYVFYIIITVLAFVYVIVSNS